MIARRLPTDLPYERLRQLLRYEASTGVFTMLVARGRKPAGTEAGYVNNEGYRQIAIDGRWFLAHRLAWFYMSGTWPCAEIDHINRNPSDNRLENLRECSRSQNEANSRRAVNRSGFRGVSELRGKWQATIKKDGRTVYLGRFSTPQEAGAAYEAAARSLHGDFSFIAPPEPPVPKQASIFDGAA